LKPFGFGAGLVTLAVNVIGVDGAVMSVSTGPVTATARFGDPAA
jgi:hypothetical protein